MAWPTISVFISSTFQDMQHERELLRERVFPVIDERVRARRHHLEIVDLRWGIWTSDEAEQADRQMRVLSVCLDEVARCRPYFLALIGDRYGWVPPRRVVEDVARERGLALPDRPLSVTELEIAAALDPSKGPVRPVVFLLDSPDGSADVQRLRWELRTAVPHSTFGYRRDQLDRFAADVLEALWRQIEPGLAAASPARSDDVAELESFVEQHVHDFVGREQAVRDCLTLASDTHPGVAVIVGSPGSGKSALFATLVSALPNTPQRLVLAHSSAMGADADKVSTMIRRFIRKLAAAAGQPVDLDPTVRPEIVDRTFADLLQRVSATRQVILLIDGVDSFEETQRARYLTWLPPNLGAHTLVVLFGRPCPALDLVESRTGTPPFPVPPLRRGEATALIRRICERHHRAMEEQTLQVLLDLTTPDGEPAHANPFWCRMAAELLNLAGADAVRSAGATSSDPETALRHQLRGMAASFPGRPAEIVTSFLQYLERMYGFELVRDFALAVLLGRHGWREQDLVGILGRSALDIAQLRRGFRAQLAQRSGSGSWAFSHELVTQATATRYAQDRNLVTQTHQAIVRHLRTLAGEDPLRESELMHHIIRSGQPTQIASHLTEDLSPGALNRAVAALADWVMIVEADAARPGDGALAVLFQPRDADLATLIWYALVMGTDVDRALEDRLSFDARRRLLEACLDFFSGENARLAQVEGVSIRVAAIRHRLAGITRETGNAEQAQTLLAQTLDYSRQATAERPDDPQALSNLAQTYYQQGLAHFNGGRMRIGGLERSIESFEKALEAMERVVQLQPRVPMHRSGVAAISTELGKLHLVMGETIMASEFYERALHHTRVTVDLDPDNPLWTGDLATSLTAVGNIHRQNGDLSKAAAYQREALRLREEIVRRNPEDPAALEDLAISHLRTAEVLRDLSDLNAANNHLRECIRVLRMLLSRDPGRQAWTRLLEEASGLLSA